MAESKTAQSIVHPASIVSPGTPVIMRTETTVPAPIPAVPGPTSFEFWTPILAFSMLVSGALALFSRSISNKVAEFEKVHKPIHDSLERDFKALEHKLNNERAKIDQLERSRGSDVERIVKLETQLHSIEKGQERIEHALEKMAGDLGNRIDGWAEQFSASIREVRDVKPR
jgi:septal ring factor EnvC (AmiA/AmiB activator)